VVIEVIIAAHTANQRKFVAINDDNVKVRHCATSLWGGVVGTQLLPTKEAVAYG